MEANNDAGKRDIVYSGARSPRTAKPTSLYQNPRKNELQQSDFRDYGKTESEDPTFNSVNITANLTVGSLAGVLKASAGVVSGSATTTDLPEGSNLYFTNERVDDRVDALIQDGSNISWTYDDAGNTLTGNVSASPSFTNVTVSSISPASVLFAGTGGLVSQDNTNFTWDNTGKFLSIANLHVKEGSNASMGIATLVAGTVTVNTTKVTANSRIFLTVEGGTLTNVGFVYVSARSSGTSFDITSSNILDASDVAWLIVEPS